MSDDARRHNRTQGKYSEKLFYSEDKGQKISPAAKEPPEKIFHKRNSGGNQSTSNSFTSENESPLKYEESSEYSFSQLEKVKKPVEIMDSGEHILSTTENGESKILYEPFFFSEDDGQEYFDRLNDATVWHSKNIVIHGIEYPQPRLVAWFGPFPYSYSGSTLEPAEMPDTVKEIKGKIEEYLASKGIDVSFNSVLLNLYRDGKDSVSWHSDDELTMGISPTIASISLGETRKFEMRPKKRHFDEESPSNVTKYFVHLVHGSLIVMTGCMQEDWQHRVPKEYHDKDRRINLTFRTVFPKDVVPEHVPVKEIKKESFAKYNSYSISSNGYKLTEEHFPPLKSGVNPIGTNMCNILDRPNYATFKKSGLSEEHWDNEISNDEQKIENTMMCKSTGATYNKYENCKNKNNSASPSETHVKVSADPHHSDRKNNFEKKSSKSFNNTTVNSSISDEQENKFHKKNVYRKFHNGEARLSVNISWENSKDKEYPKKCHSVTDTQENVDAERSLKELHNGANLSKNDIQKKDAHKKFHNSEVTTIENRENITEKGYTMKLHQAEPQPYKNISPGSNFDKEHSETYDSFVINSPVKMTQETNLDIKEPPKTWLNVDAKEFVPSNIPVREINYYSHFELKQLVHYEVPLMSSFHIRDHALALKEKVQARLYEFSRFDRDELSFLCQLTDGSQNDKNQKLISSKMCKIVINAFERNEPSNIGRSYDNNSRQCGYGNHSDRGRRFEKSWQKF